ncbi:MAG: peptidase S41 [Muribaculaceae bacterium]|nr:peptidase S41 [Muribaculaceae bacterium]
MKKHILAVALLAGAVVPALAATPLWMRDVALSPDGSRIAFCYKGDIFTVPVTGGMATRLTSTPDYEQRPVWSPDGRNIAFASDKNGNFDIYIVDSRGGLPQRLTYNSAAELPEGFTADGSAVLYSAAIQAPASSAVYPSGRLTQLWQVGVDGGAPVQALGTPARFISHVPGGKGMLYQDVKGYEDEWRKHHTSSVTRDIWLLDKDGKHTNLTDRGGENLNPVADSDGDTFYFLSERDGGSMNVYKSRISDPSVAVAVTDFKTHPVRFLSRGADGTLAFTYDGDIYTMAPDGKPVKVNVSIIDDYQPDVEKMSVTRGASESVPSPDGKNVALVWRGDVYVTSTDYSTTRRITTSPEAERHVAWSPDGKALYYTSERDGKFNIYKAVMGRGGEEPDFSHATTIIEEPVFGNDGHERTCPQVSPDGKTLAFILDRNKLAVMDLATGTVKELTDGSTYRHRDGGFYYAWSPDSRWIALEIIDRKHDPYSDVAIIDPVSGQLTNITNSGYFDQMPVWVMDGNALMFLSERYGMRNHASWGSQYDVMLAFMNQDALDRWNLSKEDLELAEDSDKNGDKKSEDKKVAVESKSNDVDVDLTRLSDRIVRVTPQSGYLTDAAMTSDGETIYYLSDAPDGGSQLWKFTPREEEHKLVTTVSGVRGFAVTPDGKNIFVMGATPRQLNTKTDKLTPISYSATTTLDHDAERRYMYDYMTREVAERFYVADMNGVDWAGLTAAYRRFLPHINNNYDFAELLSELLGELNVSHTGGRFGGYNSDMPDRTASLGLLFDVDDNKGKGLLISEVLAGGPLDKAKSKVRPGMRLTHINGVELTPSTDLSMLLTDQAGRRTLITLADGATSFDEVVKPVSTGAVSQLMYDRWVKQRAADVERLSGGRLGYVHIEGMDDDSFRRVYSDLLGKYNDREGVIIDIRWNSGGRLHEDIEVLFSGQKYFTQEIRGVETCDMPSRRWNKPSVMLMDEACYSNAHGTPWVYKNRGLGKLVGMPVPGTMTSVNWVRMVDPAMVFGIPVIGYRLPDGSFLENQQLEPDVKVANDPADLTRGEDTQLRVAVETLLQQIDEAKKN